MVRSWLAKKVISRNLRALNQGDIRPTLRMDAPDVHFRFPGTSSWATDVVGRDKVEEWLKRMVATGLQHEAHDVIASGPPWRMTIVLRGTDRLLSQKEMKRNRSRREAQRSHAGGPAKFAQEAFARFWFHVGRVHQYRRKFRSRGLGG